MAGFFMLVCERNNNRISIDFFCRERWFGALSGYIKGQASDDVSGDSENIHAPRTSRYPES